MESIRYRALRGQQLGAEADGGDGMGRAADALAALGVAVTEGGGVEALAS